jgi:hypothetical protein
MGAWVYFLEAGELGLDMPVKTVDEPEKQVFRRRSIILVARVVDGAGEQRWLPSSNYKSRYTPEQIILGALLGLTTSLEHNTATVFP